MSMYVIRGNNTIHMLEWFSSQNFTVSTQLWTKDSENKHFTV